MHPLPQVSHWETKARQFRDEGNIGAAYFMIDALAKYYGKDVARAALLRFAHLPLFLRGRGIPADWTMHTHPALYFLRDGLRPIACNGKILVRSGANVLSVSPDSPTSRAYHVFDDIPTQTGFAGMGNVSRPIEWIPYADGFLYFDAEPENGINDESDAGDNGNDELNSNSEDKMKYSSKVESVAGSAAVHRNRLCYVDLRQIDASLPLEVANKVRLRISYIEFDSDIRHIAEPLEDGSFLITLAPPIPVFSDVCRIVRFDEAKLRSALEADDPSDFIDLREFGAVLRDIVLPNAEQTLCNDCVAHGDVYLTCCGGMQNRELRFIAPDGSWRTKFLHEAPVCAVIASPSGDVSLDESGRAFLLKNQTPVGDGCFAIGKLPPDVRDNLAQCILSADWEGKKLYVTKRANFDKAEDLLDNLRSYCVTEEEVSENFEIQRVGCNPTNLLALRDGTFHFWSDAARSIDPAWQISRETATAEDWKSLLSAEDAPNPDDDPRIRWYVD